MRYILNPREWAEQTYGKAELGDQRRTQRAVKTAAGMMSHPSGSLPEQMRSAAALKGAYRLMGQEAVEYEALLQVHWDQTRAQSRSGAVVLMVHDLSDLDYTHHPSVQQVGPLGDGGGKGLLLYTTMAVERDSKRSIGIAWQKAFARQPAPRGETRAQRLQRERETEIWKESVETLGPSGEEAHWVHVADRGADNIEFMVACLEAGDDFLIRACQDRKVILPDGSEGYLKQAARGGDAQAERTLRVPARQGRRTREARVRVAWGAMQMVPPQLSHCRHHDPLQVWVVRIWEEDPPAGVEPLEWILISSRPVTCPREAWERGEEYGCRWTVEDYHKCLKTGCTMEHYRFRTGDQIKRLLGLVAPAALRLLQLRDLARSQPRALAGQQLPAALVQVVCQLADLDPQHLTVEQFWRAVAGLGGYHGRPRHGPPGWQTLWKGWIYVQTVLQGVRLASRLPEVRSPPD